jgi:uncharacterized repeat protein (TIGR01451 family)
MKTFIIAELGINHSGSFDKCIKLIREAKKSGANSAKLQIIDPNSSYQKKTKSYKEFFNYIAGNPDAVALIGSAGLTLTKKVRAVSSCPSTSSDTNPFVITNQAAKQNNLEYEITYKNNTTKKLQNVKVKDSLPIGTNFGSVSCGLTPSGNTCNTNRSGDYLEWSLTGLLNPSASGTLRFCVSQK